MASGAGAGGGTPPRSGEPASGERVWARNLGILASALAVLAFLGVTTVSDLRHRLFPGQPSVPIASPTPYWMKPDWQYARRADTACSPAVNQARQIQPMAHITYDWMANVLRLRQRLLADWRRVPIPLTGVDRAAISRMQADFEAADAYWAAMADAVYAGNPMSYNANLGPEITANASFASAASRFGFRVCDYSWPSVSAWS